ncbi:MAG TPA: hypothetical protein VK155_03980 [Bacteroidales bacterium]|nr:hypothetical protein [Bacteroidales bacterium]
MEKLRLTGISIGYDNNLIYECSRPEVMEEFKAYLDPTEVKRVDDLFLWFQVGAKQIFLVAEPRFFSGCNDEWTVRSEEIPPFNFKHAEDRNLYEEIEERIALLLNAEAIRAQSTTNA